MYPLFNNIKNKPIVILGIALVVLLLAISISSSLSNIGTMVGLNTKENISIKLEKTNNELAKAVEVLENNAIEDKVEKAIDVITSEKAVNDAIILDVIKNEEAKVLEQIKNTVIIEEVDIPDIKPNNITKVKPTIVYTIKKVNNKQKLALSILRDRAKQLKGSKV